MRKQSKPAFRFVPTSATYSVVEHVDDCELLHGYMVGVPYVGAKFQMEKGIESSTFRIHDMEEYPTKTVYVERV